MVDGPPREQNINLTGMGTADAGVGDGSTHGAVRIICQSPIFIMAVTYTYTLNLLLSLVDAGRR